MSSSTLVRVTPAPVILPCRKPQVGFSAYDHFKTRIYTKVKSQVGMLVLADSTLQINTSIRTSTRVARFELQAFLLAAVALLESTSLTVTRAGRSPAIGSLRPVNELNLRHGVMSTPAILHCTWKAMTDIPNRTCAQLRAETLGTSRGVCRCSVQGMLAQARSRSTKKPDHGPCVGPAGATARSSFLRRW
jgi:hypothetical protein